MKIMATAQSQSQPQITPEQQRADDMLFAISQQRDQALNQLVEAAAIIRALQRENAALKEINALKSRLEELK